MSGFKASGQALRGALMAVVIVALLAFVVAQFTTAQRLFALLADASWGWLLLAAIVQLVFFVLYAWMYHYGFEAVDTVTPTAGLVPVIFAAMFAKAIVPVEGAGFAAVLMADAASRGHSAARAVAVTLLVSAVDLGTALPFVAAGLAFLRVRDVAALYDYLAAVLFAVFIGVYLAVLWLAGVHRSRVRWLLGGVQGGVDRLGRLVGRPHVLAEGWAGESALEFAAAWTAIVKRPRSVVRAGAIGILLHFVSIVALLMVFEAFHQPAGFGILVTVYALGSAFYVVSITPQGVGQVEGGMALVIGSLGVPSQVAIAVTLLYRVLNVWLPVAIGFIPAQRLSWRRPAGSTTPPGTTRGTMPGSGTAQDGGQIRR